MSKKLTDSEQIDKILLSNDLPHRFYVKYACLCARYSFQYVDIKDIPRDCIDGLELAERFSNGEYVSKEELIAASASASASASAASAASAITLSAATSAAYAAYAATSASSAAYAATSASSAASSRKKAYSELKNILLNLIDNEFSQFEKVMLNL